MSAPEIVRWEEPPPSKRPPAMVEVLDAKGDLWAPVVAKLQMNPEKWAVVYEGPSSGRAASFGHQIRHGCRAGFTPAGAFDAVTRSLGGGQWATYARFVGVDDEWAA